jgi:leader peptidase (prepilin peptidase)/N-methyltransferase
LFIKGHFTDRIQEILKAFTFVGERELVTTATLLIFIVGVCLGSFLNVCIYRIPAGQSVISPPSHCMGCGTPLQVWDLIPILSFVFLRGRCRYCRQAVSWQYPLVELASGILWVLVWLVSGYSWFTIAGWVMVSVLLAVTVIDLEHLIIPDQILLAGMVAGLPFLFLHSWGNALCGIAAAIAAGGFMLAIAVISRGGMGGGDIKLAAFMGLFLGLRLVGLALFLAFLIGGLVGIGLLVSGKKGRKDAIPFGPFLALGGVLSLLWGGGIINWYLGLWT